MPRTIMLLLILVGMVAVHPLLPKTMQNAISKQDSSWDIIVPDDYSSIQEAIDKAAEGQTIYVKSGIYNECLVINKTLKIIGENREKTIIQVDAKTLINIVSDNVTISGFWLRNGQTGIYLKEAKNCQIMGNKFTNISLYATLTGGVAIYAERCSNLTIKENFFTEIDSFNVYLVSSNNCNIASNMFISTRRHSQAIGLRYSHRNVIEWNKIYGSREVTEGGIGLSSSHRNVIRYNDIRENDWCGISILNSNKTIIVGNNITKQEIQTGLFIGHTAGTIIYCNNFIGNLMDVIIKGAKNTSWSYMRLGNYWDRYMGEDNDYDGIGDTPYTLEGQNDTCPLMGPYRPFKLLDGKIIGVISNSTVTEFNYTDDDKKIALKVAGQSGSRGFCLIKIPDVIQDSCLNVTVNGKAPLKVNVNDEGNFTLLYILYLHELDENRIEIIIPEHSLCLIIFLAASTLPVVLRKRALGKN